ncbi:MAG: hypothetical protein AAF203_03215 [Pseudomonadota bacterium]
MKTLFLQLMLFIIVGFPTINASARVIEGQTCKNFLTSANQSYQDLYNKIDATVGNESADPHVYYSLHNHIPQFFAKTIYEGARSKSWDKYTVPYIFASKRLVNECASKCEGVVVTKGSRSTRFNCKIFEKIRPLSLSRFLDEVNFLDSDTITTELAQNNVPLDCLDTSLLESDDTAKYLCEVAEAAAKTKKEAPEAAPVLEVTRKELGLPPEAKKEISDEEFLYPEPEMTAQRRAQQVMEAYEHQEPSSF